MSDETKPGTDPAAKPDDAEAGNPEGTGADAAAQPQDGTTAQSGLTADQIAELAAFRDAMKAANITNPRDFYADYTRKSQAVAALEQQNARYAEAVQSLSGRVREQTDPIEALRARLIEAKQSFDPVAEADAQIALQRAISRQEAAAESQKAMSQSRADAELDKLARALGVDRDTARQRATQVVQGFDADDVLNAIRRREGTLAKHLTDAEAKRKAEADKAARLNSFLGDGSGGRVPGAFPGNQPDTEEPNGLHWLAMSPAARKKKYGGLKPSMEP